MILANDVSRAGIGFDVPDNQVTLLAADGRCADWPRLRKTTLAFRLVRAIERAAASRAAAGPLNFF